MAIKITSTQKSVNCVKVLVYGDAGFGKTRLCATVPKPIILSAEAGLLSLASEDIPVIEIKTVQDVMDAYEWLTEDEEGKKFETICLDSVSEIGEVLLADLKHRHKDARAAYGELSEDMTKLIRAFRDIPDRNVYFTAKQIRVEDDAGKVSFRPALPGKSLLNNMPFFFDEVFCIRSAKTESGKEYKYLQTTSDSKYVCKDRSGTLDEMCEPNLGKVFKTIKSGVKEEKPEEKPEEKN